MVAKGTILVGTVGQGVMRGDEQGESWIRSGVNLGMHSDSIVRALASDTRRAGVVHAGTDLGLYRSEDGGVHWRLEDTPMNGLVVWALAIDPTDPDIMFAGTGTPSRSGVFRSVDGGKAWEPCAVEIAETCPNVGVPRVTGIAIDPSNHRSVWVGIEVDGLRHSTDGGETWERVDGAITNKDVHNVLVTGAEAAGPQTVFTVVSDDVWTSTDDGASWRAVGVKEVFPWSYPRGIATRPDDPAVVFITIGDTTPGQTGAVMRSTDGGKSWESLALPQQPNSAMWTVSVSASAPDSVLAASRYGYLYRSDDGGDSWCKFGREFSEISSLLWVDALD